MELSKLFSALIAILTAVALAIAGCASEESRRDQGVADGGAAEGKNDDFSEASCEAIGASEGVDTGTEDALFECEIEGVSQLVYARDGNLDDAFLCAQYPGSSAYECSGYDAVAIVAGRANVFLWDGDAAPQRVERISAFPGAVSITLDAGDTSVELDYETVVEHAQLPATRAMLLATVLHHAGTLEHAFDEDDVVAAGLVSTPGPEWNQAVSDQLGALWTFVGQNNAAILAGLGESRDARTMLVQGEGGAIATEDATDLTDADALRMIAATIGMTASTFVSPTAAGLDDATGALAVENGGIANHCSPPWAGALTSQQQHTLLVSALFVVGGFVLMFAFGPAAWAIGIGIVLVLVGAVVGTGVFGSQRLEGWFKCWLDELVAGLF